MTAGISDLVVTTDIGCLTNVHVIFIFFTAGQRMSFCLVHWQSCWTMRGVCYDFLFLQ